MIPAYVEAICKEIAQVADGFARQHPGEGPIPVHTVFFGGGTPSLLAAEQLGAILGALRERFSFQPEMEITLEANPGTVVTQEYLTALHGLGINRLSFGMQSAHPDDLRLLEREHDFFDVLQAVQWARAAGFDNLSVDLIFGLPGQSLERWKETLERAIALGTDHLSLYSLTIEHGTPLYKRWLRGMVPLVDDDLAADMYEWAIEALPRAGFEQYEVSNWARRAPDGALLAARHNLQYWRNHPYLGLGPGAHGFAAGHRTMNVGGIRPFIERCAAAAPVDFPCSPATRRAIPVSRQDEMQETMMVGLRLTQEGVADNAFRARFGQSISEAFPKEVARLLKAGLIEWVGEEEQRLRLTQRGLLVGNQVFMQFVGE